MIAYFGFSSFSTERRDRRVKPRGVGSLPGESTSYLSDAVSPVKVRGTGGGTRGGLQRQDHCAGAANGRGDIDSALQDCGADAEGRWPEGRESAWSNPACVSSCWAVGHVRRWPAPGVRSGRQRSLLAYSILHRQHPQPRQRLAFLFWPTPRRRRRRTCAGAPSCAARRTRIQRCLRIDDEKVLEWRADTRTRRTCASWRTLARASGDGLRPARRARGGPGAVPGRSAAGLLRRVDRARARPSAAPVPQGAGGSCRPPRTAARVRRGHRARPTAPPARPLERRCLSPSHAATDTQRRPRIGRAGLPCVRHRAAARPAMSSRTPRRRSRIGASWIWRRPHCRRRPSRPRPPWSAGLRSGSACLLP